MRLLDKIAGRVDVLEVRFSDKSSYALTLRRCTIAQDGFIETDAMHDFTPENFDSTYPLYLTICGYGIVSKSDDAQNAQLIRRVTEQNADFISNRTTDGDFCFVRKEQLETIYSLFTSHEMTIFDVIVCGTEDRNSILREVWALWLQQSKLKSIIKSNIKAEVIAALIVRRIKFPVLIALLVLLGANYVINGNIRDKYIANHTALTALDAQESRQEHTIDFASNPLRHRFAMLSDRVAMCVPRNIMLKSFCVQPLSKKIEIGEQLTVKSSTAEIIGICIKADEVSEFVAALKRIDILSGVHLASLERDGKTNQITFKIELSL